MQWCNACSIRLGLPTSNVLHYGECEVCKNPLTKVQGVHSNAVHPLRDTEWSKVGRYGGKTNWLTGGKQGAGDGESVRAGEAQREGL